MSDLPKKGTFKIQTIGPMKTGTAKSGNKWRTFELQFEGDPQWYNTFWTPKEDPAEGKELTGEKSYDENYSSYKFEIDRQRGKNNWNPAAANATVMMAAAEVVNGFLRLGNHYELWEKGDEKLKPKFEKYVSTVVAASDTMKEKVVSMGGLAPEQKTAEKKSGDGDPGPTPPPDLDEIPVDEELVDV